MLYNLAPGNNKRNYMSMAGDIACIPSTGVCSEHWQRVDADSVGPSARAGGIQVFPDIIPIPYRWLTG